MQTLPIFPPESKNCEKFTFFTICSGLLFRETFTSFYRDFYTSRLIRLKFHDTLSEDFTDTVF